MSSEPRGRSAAENGRARSAAWVDAVGPLPATLVGADGKSGEGHAPGSAAVVVVLPDNVKHEPLSKITPGAVLIAPTLAARRRAAPADVGFETDCS